MGIYIKGMEMPKNEPLLVKINPDGSVSTTAKNGYKKYQAVPVPPHGRLIDADALEKIMCEGIAPSVKDGGFKHPFDIIRAVANAPTIIPADHIGDANQNDNDYAGLKVKYIVRKASS